MAFIRNFMWRLLRLDRQREEAEKHLRERKQAQVDRVRDLRVAKLIEASNSMQTALYSMVHEDNR